MHPKWQSRRRAAGHPSVQFAVRAVKRTATGSLRDFITKRYLSEQDKQSMWRESLFVPSAETSSPQFRDRVPNKSVQNSIVRIGLLSITTKL